jgi:DNA polymerase III subunit delta
LKLNPDTLPAHLRERLLPAYLISGDEPLLAGEAADALRARARAGGFSEREVFFPERAADWDQVRGAARSLSLFAARRLIEIRLATARPGTAGNAALIELLGARDPDTLYLVLTPRLDREAQSAEWVRAVEAQGAWVQVWPVDAARLPAWLRARARQLGLEASDAAFELLAARTEGNLLAAQQELMRLALLGAAEDGPGSGAQSAAAGTQVSAATVRSSVADSARFDVFQLGEAVLDGSAARALRVLAGLRAEGTEATLALWALTRALHDVWNALASPPGAARGWQRRSAALERALKRAPRLDFGALTTRAARADRMIKGRLAGNAWDELALLVAELCAMPVTAAPPRTLAAVS